jgi:UDP-N-acetylmuramoylalanine--D-glutamate ligase
MAASGRRGAGEVPAPGASVLVVGLGLSGTAVVRHGARADVAWRVTVIEDRPDGTGVAEQIAEVRRAHGANIVAAPSPDEAAALVDTAVLVVTSPGVPLAHPAFERARQTGTPLWSEIELAARLAPVPYVGITGTNGKTTVTTLTHELLAAGGRRSVACGNIGHPFVAAVDEALDGTAATSDGGVDVLVAEMAALQLEHTVALRPRVATVMNVADDHFDHFGTLSAYAAAKAKLFARQSGDDLLVANADDPAVVELVAASPAPARVAWFTVAGRRDGAWSADGVALYDPSGAVLAECAALPRRLPHDLANALAAAAAAADLGASATSIAATLATFRPPRHRIELVGERPDGVAFYDDSKATNPHAALAAIRGFPSVVLIAGGRNKDLDLGALLAGVDHVRAVVAIGESAEEVAAVFGGQRPVALAASMRDAVARADELAQPGDAVLLSPATASFDWYRNYGERGDDFAREVRRLLDLVGAGNGREERR